MSFLPNGGTILLFYIILLSLSFSPNSSRRPRLHRLYAKEVARPVFFPFKSVDKLAISSPRILNGGRWRAEEREKSRGISKGLSNFCGEEISLESWHPPLPAQQDHGPPQQILHQILELFRFLFHRICVHPVRPRYAHRSLAHVSDFTCVGFYGRSWRRMFKASKDHCLSRSFEEDQKNLLFGRRIYIYIFVSCQRMVAMWREPLLIFIYVHRCIREGTRSSSSLLLPPSSSFTPFFTLSVSR